MLHLILGAGPAGVIAAETIRPRPFACREIPVFPGLTAAIGSLSFRCFCN